MAQSVEGVTGKLVEVALEIIPGATHLFEEPGALERVAQLAADWFVHHTAEKRR